MIAVDIGGSHITSTHVIDVAKGKIATRVLKVWNGGHCYRREYFKIMALLWITN